MTNVGDVQVLLSALRAIEKLHFQTVALETLLDFYKVPNWDPQCEKLATNTTIQPEVRARFQKLYAELERDLDLSVAQAFLRSLPKSGEPN